MYVIYLRGKHVQKTSRETWKINRKIDDYLYRNFYFGCFLPWKTQACFGAKNLHWNEFLLECRLLNRCFCILPKRHIDKLFLFYTSECMWFLKFVELCSHIFGLMITLCFHSISSLASMFLRNNLTSIVILYRFECYILTQISLERGSCLIFSFSLVWDFKGQTKWNKFLGSEKTMYVELNTTLTSP